MKCHYVAHLVTAITLFGTGLMLDIKTNEAGQLLTITSQAEARVGRPLTPMSVAGVSRRTSRRVYRRHHGYPYY
jgi:hypothetical protein